MDPQPGMSLTRQRHSRLNAGMLEPKATDWCPNYAFPMGFLIFYALRMLSHRPSRLRMHSMHLRQGLSALPVMAL